MFLFLNPWSSLEEGKRSLEPVRGADDTGLIIPKEPLLMFLLAALEKAVKSWLLLCFSIRKKSICAVT